MVISIIVITVICVFIPVGVFILRKGILLRKRDESKGYKHTTDIVLIGIYLIITGVVMAIVYLYKVFKDI